MRLPTIISLLFIFVCALASRETLAFSPATTARPTTSTRGISTRFRPPPFIKEEYCNSPQRPRHYSTVKPLQASSSPAATALLAVAGTPVASLAILAGIILIHEAGHYIAARGLGIEVEEFSIGVGPKLFGFKAFGDEFNLRGLPLGGYVRFPENYNTTVAQELERSAFKAAEEFDKKQPKDLKDTVLNALTLGAIDDRRRREEKERRSLAAEEFKKRPWWNRIGAKKETETILDADDVQIEYYDDPNLLQNRPWQQRAVVLSGGVIFNIILSFLISFGQINFGPGVPKPVFEAGALISSTPRPGVAASGLLEKGDVVVSVNGAPITLSSSPSATEAQKGIANFISTIRATPDGQTLQLSVLHPGDTKPVDVTVRPQHSSSDSKVSGTATIGVLLSPNFVKSQVIQSDSILDGVRLAGKYVGTITMDTAKGLLGVFGSLIAGKGAGGQVSGPIGLIRTGSEVVATQDWTTILLFASTISINLAVVNALPLPALDGGQLVFVLSEALTGRKVDQRLQEGLTGAALFFLLLLSASTAIGDIGSLFSM